MLGAEDAGALPWDPLREQDWNSLGLGDESVMEGALWEGVGDGVVGSMVGHSGCEGLDVGEAGAHKSSTQFSPMTIDAQFDCFWDNFPVDGLDAAAHDGPRNLGAHHDHGAHEPRAHPHAPQAGGMRSSGIAKPRSSAGAESRADWAAKAPRSPKTAKVPVHVHTGGVPLMQLPRNGPHAGAGHTFMGMPAHQGAGQHAEIERNMPPPCFDGSHHIRVKGKDMLVFPLFVAAIGEGNLILDIPDAQRATLEQVERKVTKEQNTAVNLSSEAGAVELKLRIFPATSPEAVAMHDYMVRHANQVPAPLVVLHSCLHMAVAYDASDASAADRLRKRVKTHAIKVVREVLSDERCTISSACLLGRQGALAPAHHLKLLIDDKMTLLDEGVSGAAPAPGMPDMRRVVVVPTKKPRAPREDASSGHHHVHHLPAAISGAAFVAPANGGQAHPFGTLPGTLQAHINGGVGVRGHHSPPDTSSRPSTPDMSLDRDSVALDRDSVGPSGAPCLSAYFPVSLFVTAIAEGEISSDTPNKVAERLSLIVRKVPKEQNTSVDMGEGIGSVPLQMRVFVVNSEDAKAVGEYINGHMNQVRAPVRHACDLAAALPARRLTAARALPKTIIKNNMLMGRCRRLLWC